MNNREQPAKPHLDEAPDPKADPLRRIRSEELFAGKLEVLIEHDGQTYRLRLTRSGKLILHK
jgi:hemin uptake protein HemP